MRAVTNGVVKRTWIVAALLSMGALNANAITFLTTCQTLTSGTYVLNANVTAPANGPCFTFQGDNITLNLAGHKVTGSLGAAALTDGGVARHALTVAGGNLEVDIGIDFSRSSEVRVESLNIDSSSGPAISVGPYSKLLAN